MFACLAVGYIGLLFETSSSSANSWATFTWYKSPIYVLILTKKWVGLNFGRFFHKLIWSPCTGRLLFEKNKTLWNRATKICCVPRHKNHTTNDFFSKFKYTNIYVHRYYPGAQMYPNQIPTYWRKRRSLTVCWFIFCFYVDGSLF
jgi:hypothetical protein